MTLSSISVSFRVVLFHLNLTFLFFIYSFNLFSIRLTLPKDKPKKKQLFIFPLAVQIIPAVTLTKQGNKTGTLASKRKAVLAIS